MEKGKLTATDEGSTTDMRMEGILKVDREQAKGKEGRVNQGGRGDIKKKEKGKKRRIEKTSMC